MSSSGTSILMIWSKDILICPSKSSNASACAIVLGKPSSKNPFLQSSSKNLSLIICIIILSGTKLPISIYFFADKPISVFLFTLFLNISPVDM